MIRRLSPFFANVQKRLTKSPKLYVRDTGLLHHLAGLRRPSDLATWPRRGSSFEGLVIEELGSSVDRHAYAGLRQCMSDLGLRRGWVVTTSADARVLAPGIELVPWQRIAAGEIDFF